jgi:hypothetical protein
MNIIVSISDTEGDFLESIGVSLLRFHFSVPFLLLLSSFQEP